MRILLATLLFGLVGTTTAQEASPEQQIRETLRTLPEELREAAIVIGYVEGERVVLQGGEGNMICWADDPELSDARGAFYSSCFPKSLLPYEERRAEIAAPDKSFIPIMAAEIEQGDYDMPDAAIRYTLRGHSAEAAIPLAVLHVPYASAEELGVSSEPDNFRPWLMDEGTVNAHLMLPGK